MAEEKPRIMTMKKLYEEMTTSPAKISMGHTTQKMDIADSMFDAPKAKKMAKGGCCRGDGVAQRGKTKGRMV